MYLYVRCAITEELKEAIKEELKDLYVCVRQMCNNGRSKGRIKGRIQGFVCICTSDVQ